MTRLYTDGEAATIKPMRTVILGTILVASAIFATPALAQDTGTDPYIGTSTTAVSPSSVEANTTVPAAQESAAVAQQQSSTLAFTGTDVMWLVAIGVSLVAVGAVLARRRNARTDS
jgi:LPXTG-motif cell wall-anchored protein